jgi:lycopene cyclase domain-containing protein
MSTYFIVNLLALSMPFLLSFDKKVHFYTNWRYVFPAIFLTMLLFVPWDILFTIRGVWGFNPKHLGGIYLLRLPLEEWLFFIIVPYSSLFTYEVLKAYKKNDVFVKYSDIISKGLVFILLLVAFANIHKAYTSVSFILTATAIFIMKFVLKVDFMGRFYFAYLIVLIPFLIVNGVLTGSFIDEEIVWYNNAENLSIRLFTIPVEDTVYGFLMILLNVFFFEKLKKQG